MHFPPLPSWSHAAAAASALDPAGPRMTRARALWLVPAMLAVHNLEEALWMPRVLPLDAQRLPTALRTVLSGVVYPHFVAVLLLATLVPVVLAGAGGLHRPGRWNVFLLLAVQTALLLNVGFHLAAALVLGGYAPGLVTAVLLNLPFSVYLIRRAVRERWVGGRALLWLPPLALLLHGPVLIGLLVASRWMMGAVR